MEDKDEYICSLLLSLFLMQGEVDRLNQTLDLARKGELVYINNPQLEELKAENERLKEEISDFISDISTCGFKYDGRCPDDLDELQSSIEYLCNKFDNYKQTLQEIKTIAENAYCLTNYTNKDMADFAKLILQKITKEKK